MARALHKQGVNRAMDWSADVREVRRPGYLRESQGQPARDWLDEFPVESDRESVTEHSDSRMWVEVHHPPLAAPPHTEYRRFSALAWVRSNPSRARALAVALAVVSGALLGVAAWMQRNAGQPGTVAQSDLVQSRPIQSAPPAASPLRPPPPVFTSEATTPRIADAASRVKVAPPPARPSASRSPSATRSSSPPPARTIADARAAAAATSRVVAPPLPASSRALPPVTNNAGSTAAPPPVPVPSPTVTTTRPPVDNSALVLSAAEREPARPLRELSNAPAAPAAPPAASAEARERAIVEGLIEKYRFAFSTLNSGVSDFWPGVNGRALDRAFNELEQQQFEFDRCTVQVTGNQAAATCSGRATFVPKVGNKTPRTQPRQWAFRFVQTGNRWIIDTVQSR